MSTDDNEIINIRMTRGQAKYVEKCIDICRIKGNKGREFAAMRAVKKALGTWKEKDET